MARSDYDRFLALLYLCNRKEPVDLKLQGSTLLEIGDGIQSDTLVDICAYVLMPNHFHIIVREKEDGGISKLMQKLTTGYTMYFNKRNERSGALFQGKFKASHIENDRYFSYLISYVHLNPIKLFEPTWKESGIQDRVSAEKFLKGYAFSSYLDYMGETRLENKIINADSLPEYFSSEQEFEHLVTEWLTYSSE